jgi:hypothetical protein
LLAKVGGATRTSREREHWARARSADVDLRNLPFDVGADWVATDDFHPEDTDTLADFNRSKFLDLNKPLLKQVFFANFS